MFAGSGPQVEEQTLGADLTTSYQSGNVLLRAVTEPMVVSRCREKSRHLGGADYGRILPEGVVETRAEVEVRKTYRRHGDDSGSAKPDAYVKHGNPARDFTRAGPPYAEAGFGVFLPEQIQAPGPQTPADGQHTTGEVQEVSSSLSATSAQQVIAQGEATQFITDNWPRWFAGHHVSVLFETVTADVMHYDFIFYTVSPTLTSDRFHGAVAGDGATPAGCWHTSSAILQADYLRRVHLSATGRSLPVVEFRAEGGTFHEVQLSDENVLEYWRVLLVDHGERMIGLPEYWEGVWGASDGQYLLSALTHPSVVDDQRVDLSRLYSDQRLNEGLVELILRARPSVKIVIMTQVMCRLQYQSEELFSPEVMAVLRVCGEDEFSACRQSIESALAYVAGTERALSLDEFIFVSNLISRCEPDESGRANHLRPFLPKLLMSYPVNLVGESEMHQVMVEVARFVASLGLEVEPCYQAWSQAVRSSLEAVVVNFQDGQTWGAVVDVWSGLSSLGEIVTSAEAREFFSAIMLSAELQPQATREWLGSYVVPILNVAAVRRRDREFSFLLRIMTGLVWEMLRPGDGEQQASGDSFSHEGASLESLRRAWGACLSGLQALGGRFQVQDLEEYICFLENLVMSAQRLGICEQNSEVLLTEIERLFARGGDDICIHLQHVAIIMEGLVNANAAVGARALTIILGAAERWTLSQCPLYLRAEMVRAVLGAAVSLAERWGGVEVSYAGIQTWLLSLWERDSPAPRAEDASGYLAFMHLYLAHESLLGDIPGSLLERVAQLLEVPDLPEDYHRRLQVLYNGEVNRSSTSDDDDSGNDMSLSSPTSVAATGDVEGRSLGPGR